MMPGPALGLGLYPRTARQPFATGLHGVAEELMRSWVATAAAAGLWIKDDGLKCGISVVIQFMHGWFNKAVPTK